MSSLFEWDKHKSKTNFDKHGIYFEEVVNAWNETFVELKGIAKSEQKEKRRGTLGVIYEKIFTIIWTKRKGKIRIISARRARKKEEIAYSISLQNHKRNG